MSEPPARLTAFPYLVSQWADIETLVQAQPALADHDLQQDWRQFSHAFAQAHPTPDPFTCLRRFKRSRLAYMAYLDLSLPLSAHTMTMQRVADLADLMIQQAHALASEEMQTRHGQLRDANQQVVELMVFALGKLGTSELNYASDVDLVFLYEAEGQSDGPRPLDALSYFTRMGQKLIKYLDHYTADGQVYRVDMRLRPFGSAAPLACSVAAFQQYLVVEGRDWERFAWMRARLVAGPATAGTEVMAGIQPFLYRRHLDYAVFGALAQIKAEIAQQVSRQADDLKLGTGGIRAVEFIVQSMQLVFGGRHASLQGQSIAPQIHALVAAGKLSEAKGAALHEAWLWLRKIENMAQMVAEQATHELPQDPAVQAVLVTAMGQSDWPQLCQRLHGHRQTVVALLDEVFVIEDAPSALAPPQKDALSELMAGFPVARMPANRREQVMALLGRALQLVPVSVVETLAELLKKILTRPSYLLMLQKERNLLSMVLQLFQRHPYFGASLQAYPVLLEQLFEAQDLPATAAQMQQQWQSVRPSVEDVEQWMEDLRYFKLVQQFNLVRAWTEQTVSNAELGQRLTWLAQCVLQAVVPFAWREIQAKAPATAIDREALVVIAYGSAATGQMNTQSDLDLVFVVDDSLANPDAAVFTQKWVKRIIHHLTSSLYHGALYALDMQLRPNGNSGPLVTTRQQFEHYQTQQAWTWEHAALVKARTLVGTAEQQAWFEALRQRVLQQDREPLAVDQDLQNMAAKLALAAGADDQTRKAHQAEFAVLGGVLNHSQQHPELMHSRDLSTLQQQLLDLGLLDPSQLLYWRPKKDPVG
ncbi:hypothetical protein [Marinicella meishanensis]|uniref:[protein-PII] uridylyltransferase family protein n=1 Tax=Marinicella meishanensis TaxID=2873263 RepID=UPI001CBC9331|nr:hypothetical protein [Marinicella sp. NBU2979]